MSSDSKHELLIRHFNWNFQRAKVWFWPIVIGFTIFFGLFAGVEGAFVGFFYGLVCAGFLLYESLPVSKK